MRFVKTINVAVEDLRPGDHVTTPAGSLFVTSVHSHRPGRHAVDFQVSDSYDTGAVLRVAIHDPSDPRLPTIPEQQNDSPNHAIAGDEGDGGVGGSEVAG